MKKLLLIAALFLTLPVCSQFELTGKIFDSQSQEIIPDATVFIRTINKQAITNSSGVYQIQLEKGDYEIEVFSFGMTPVFQNISLTKDTTVDFRLKPLIQEIEGVEIKSQRDYSQGMTRMRAIDGTGIYAAKKNEVIVLDDFAANLVANNARQAFAKVPGLNIWESDFAGLQLDIAARGLGPSRTANFNTRQNGYDMSADALGYPESYYIPALQAVERIEIVRGAASLQYGTQFGGMLNFKIKEAPKDKKFALNAEQAFGSFGLVNSFISLGGTSGKVDYYGYYQYREGDGWRESSGFNAHTAFGRMGIEVNEKLKLGFEYSFLDYQAQQPGGLTDEDFNNGDVEKARRDRNWFHVNWNLIAATLDYRFSSMTQLNIRTFGLLSERNALGNLSQIGVPDNPEENRTLIRDNFQNFGSEARILHRYDLFGKFSALVVGMRYYHGLTERKQGDANNSSDPDFEFLNPDDPEEFDYDFPSRNLAVFVENLTYLTSRLSFTIGARFEYIRTDAEGIWKQNQRDFAGNLISSVVNTDQKTEERSFPLFGLGLGYKINEDLGLYGNLSQNFRSITFSDLRVVNPNFQLDSLITDENGYNLDIGIRGNLTNWLSMDVSAFLLRYNDRIGLYALPGSTTLFRTNIGDSRHIGIESFLEMDIDKILFKEERESNISVFVNLALTNAEYIESDISSIEGRRVEYVPEVMIRTGMNYRFKGLKATYQFSYLGDQFSDATNSTFNPNALTGIIPSYYVMDLSFEYRWKSFKATTGVNNVTDELYFTRRAASYPGPGIIPATIRSFYFSIGVTL